VRNCTPGGNLGEGKSGGRACFKPLAQERGVWVNYRRPTQAFCRRTLRRRIRPSFDTWVLGEIKPRDVQRFVNALWDYSHSELRYPRAALGRVMNMAVKWNYVSLNPVLGLELPRGLAPVRAQVLQPAEVQAIVNALARPYRTVVVIMAGTATREWELLTLKWEDVDSLKRSHTCAPVGLSQDGRFGNINRRKPARTSHQREVLRPLPRCKRASTTAGNTSS
jgi:integrase